MEGKNVAHVFNTLPLKSSWYDKRNTKIYQNLHLCRDYQHPQVCRRYHANGKKWRGTKEPLDEVKKESKKAGLKLSVQKTKIMSSDPINSQQIDGEKAETVTDFIFLGSKITADCYCSHGINKALLLEWKALTNLDRVLKSRDMTANKGPSSQIYDLF